MDITEVAVGQFKKFLAESNHPFSGDLWKDIYEVSPTDDHPIFNFCFPVDSEISTSCQPNIILTAEFRSHLRP